MWEGPSAKILEKAAARKVALFILFVGESDESNEAAYIYGKDIIALATNKATFIRVPYTSDREPGWDDGSMVPTSKILGSNPSRDYGIKTYPTMIVADCYGNECYRLTAKPDASSLEKKIDAVADTMKRSNERLQKGLESAKSAFETKDRGKTLRTLVDNFKTGLVGLEAQESSVKLYHEIIDAGRKDLDEAVAAGGKDLVTRLKDLKKIFKDTELNKDIDAALKNSK